MINWNKEPLMILSLFWVYSVSLKVHTLLKYPKLIHAKQTESKVVFLNLELPNRWTANANGISVCMWRWHQSHTTSTENSPTNLYPQKREVLNHLPSSGGCSRQDINIYSWSCQCLRLVRWNWPPMVMAVRDGTDKTTAAWKLRCTSSRCGKQSWELQVSTAFYDFMVVKETILTDCQS